MIKRLEIQIRDPFILRDDNQKKYYLYGTTDKDCWKGKASGFEAYSSTDLENWDGPYKVFTPDDSFWADKNYWAPEVYLYKEKYYMFASFKADGVCRGTQILAADTPKGPFHPHSDGPITPKEWECLDGTLFVDDSGDPWMIFCHEWVQICDGEMLAMKLTNGLKAADEEPKLLFKASEASWCVSGVRTFIEDGKPVEHDGYVTDGPFIYRAQNGELLMMWSSRGKEGYAMGIARSSSGNILGPWTHDEEPIYSKDGGHGMIFKTFENELMMTIHTPNKTPNERPVFLKLEENKGKMCIK